MVILRAVCSKANFDDETVAPTSGKSVRSPLSGSVCCT